MLIILAMLSLFCCVTFVALNQFYKKTNDYKNSCIDIKSYQSGIPKDLKMVTMGSTYSKFAFSGCAELRLNVIDLSLQAESLEMDNAILKQYIDRMDKGCVVVIAVAACLLLYKGNENNPLYYQILNDKNNPRYNWKGKLKSLFPLIKNPKKVKKIFIDTEEYEDIYESMPVNVTESDSSKMLNDLVTCWKELFDMKDLKSIELSDANAEIVRENQQYLIEMLELCKTQNLRPVVVVPPFSIRLNHYFSTEFKEKLINETIGTITDSRNIPFLNYQDDAEFQNSPELFVDGGFRLNKYGSMVFIRKFAKDLQKYEIDICNGTLGRQLDHVEKNENKTTIRKGKAFNL